MDPNQVCITIVMKVLGSKLMCKNEHKQACHATVWSELISLDACRQVEEQKRRAEADKLAAITALEQRSREFMREKEEKRRLEARIANMQSQLLIGGSKLEDTPVFRCRLCLL